MKAGRRKEISGSFPVAGRPRFLGITFIDLAIFYVILKKEAGRKRQIYHLLWGYKLNAAQESGTGQTATSFQSA
jgi:hypothetical protein